MKNSDQPIHPCLMQRIANGDDKCSFRLNKPVDDKAWTFASSPLTKREEFSRTAMLGLLSNPVIKRPLSTDDDIDEEHVRFAKLCLRYADALLNELEK